MFLVAGTILADPQKLVELLKDEKGIEVRIRDLK